MNNFIGILGIVLVIGLTYLLSHDKKNINWTGIGKALVAQLVLAFVMIKTPVWKVIEVIAGGVSWVISQSTAGISFVFGGLTDNYVFFINSLLPIVFISSLIGLLFHFGIIQKFIKVIGKVIAKVFNIDTIVAVNLATNMFLGQGESLFLTKSYLPKVKDSVIFATLVGGMSSISVSVMGLYTSMGADLSWIIASLPIIVFSSMILTQIVAPTQYDSAEIEFEDDRGTNFLDTMMSYAQTGFKGVIGISVALMVFLSAVALINNFIGIFTDSFTLQSLVGYAFYPIAWLMGVPSAEISQVAQLLGTKIVTNEAVAFGLPSYNALSPAVKATMTTVLASFAGFGSIGIMIGSYTAVAPSKAKVVAKYGAKALLVATLGSILTGSIIGLML